MNAAPSRRRTSRRCAASAPVAVRGRVTQRSATSVSTMRPPAPSTSSTAPISTCATSTHRPGNPVAWSAGPPLGILRLPPPRSRAQAAALVRPQARGHRPCASIERWSPCSTMRPSSITTSRSSAMHGGEAVRDRDHRLVLHQVLQAFLDRRFHFRVERRWSLRRAAAIGRVLADITRAIAMRWRWPPEASRRVRRPAPRSRFLRPCGSLRPLMKPLRLRPPRGAQQIRLAGGRQART